MTPSAQFPWSPGFVAPSFARAPYGLGDAQEIQYSNLATSSAGTGVSAIAAAGILGPLAATGIGLAIVGIGVALDLLFTPSLYHQQETATTQIVNSAEPILRDNRDMYLRQAVRTLAMQQAALSNFDTTWSRVVQLCSQPSEGAPGQRCISERQAGGVAPWCQNPGNVGCDWFALYRDPIANDSGIVTVNAPATAGASSSAPAVPAAALPVPTGNGTAAGSGSGKLYFGLALIAFALGYALTE